MHTVNATKSPLLIQTGRLKLKHLFTAGAVCWSLAPLGFNAKNEESQVSSLATVLTSLNSNDNDLKGVRQLYLLYSIVNKHG